MFQENITLLKSIVEAMPAPIFFKDIDARYRLVNKAFTDFNGVTEADVIGKTVHECWHKDSAEIFYDKDRDLFGKPGVQIYETQMTNARGEIRNVVFHKATVHARDGTCQGIIGVILDITERKQAELALQRESQRNEMLLRMASDGVHILDGEGNLMQMSDSFCQMLGYTREEMQGMHVSGWDARWSDVELRENIGRLLSLDVHGTTFETIHRRKDGTLFNVEVSSMGIVLDGATMLYCSSRDITERKLTEEIIHRHANYDPLTQLPNRRLFRDRLEQGIKKAHRAGSPMALLLIDLDHFKEVNDTLGHHVGDELLVEAARRITGNMRESDTVARLGGDEFTVILSELHDGISIDHIAQDIITRLASPFQLGDEKVFVSASIGITLYPNDAEDIETLLKNADQAMYLAKSKGRNRFSYYTAALQEAAQKRMRLVNDLHSALEGDQLRVHYQPIMALATGSIHKAEALVCWQHPVRGLISPAEFIPLAEETGMIADIGDWVFKQAVQQAKHWRAVYDATFQISVNKSPVQFRKHDNVDTEWLLYLQEAGLPGQSIVIEITEGLLLHADKEVTDQLLAFRDAGIQVAIDDFGTGYSSLSYLKKFDIDYLKIDQSFVHNLDSGSEDMVLCEAIIMMAHKLGLQVIAEGVETPEQRDLLIRAGCDYAQGYLFSRPLRAVEFEKLLAK